MAKVHRVVPPLRPLTMSGCVNSGYSLPPLRQPRKHKKDSQCHKMDTECLFQSQVSARLQRVLQEGNHGFGRAVAFVGRVMFTAHVQYESG